MMITPKTLTIAHLEVLVMPNGEILCLGKTLGRVDTLGRLLSPAPTKRPKAGPTRKPTAAELVKRPVVSNGSSDHE
jgi:hypothetical protein